MQKHTIHNCLRKKSTEQLDFILNYYLRGDLYKKYDFAILATLEVLQERMESFVPTEEEYRMMEKLLAYKPRTEDRI